MRFERLESGGCVIRKLGCERLIWAFMEVEVIMEAKGGRSWLERAERRDLSMMVRV